ncbi:hypothetical protein THTE_1238 [Thermogutta terrifontis]|uniref:Uncharacterized protein n=1 Tax=Thermogutta terrifontis TaxID=1331910 RepID=A0A286RD04_9BACT|nr:hypothetical protein THTE_1238 [Thermogutta terrifontis]
MEGLVEVLAPFQHRTKSGNEWGPQLWNLLVREVKIKGWA